MAATPARRGLRRDQESLKTRRIIVTTGEPAGIGPELALAAALTDWPAELVFAGDPDLLAARASALGLGLTPSDWRPDAPPAPHRAGTLPVLAARLAREVVAGHPDPANARYVLALLDAAAEGCLAGRFDAMVTAPVQKASINDAGIPFPGHTEYLAAKSARRAPRDAARRRAAARRAGDDPPAARRGAAGHHARIARTHDAGARSRAARGLRDRRAAHPRLRPQPARRRRRSPRPRGDRGHRPRGRRARRAGPRRHGPGARRHGLHAGTPSSAPTSCSRCTTTRACR